MVVENSDLTWKRPAHGISPKFINEVVGKKANKDISEDTLLQWNFFHNSN